MTTVGFGDYTSTSTNEYLFSCFLEVKTENFLFSINKEPKYWGVGYMAYFQSNMIYFAHKLVQSQFDIKKEEVKQFVIGSAHKFFQEREIELWLYKQECGNPAKMMDIALSNEIKDYCVFHNINNFEPLLNQHRFLLQLPPPTRRDLEAYIFEKLLKTFSTFFQNVVEETFVFELLTKLRPEAYLIAYYLSFILNVF